MDLRFSPVTFPHSELRSGDLFSSAACAYLTLRDPSYRELVYLGSSLGSGFYAPRDPLEPQMPVQRAGCCGGVITDSPMAGQQGVCPQAYSPPPPPRRADAEHQEGGWTDQELNSDVLVSVLFRIKRTNPLAPPTVTPTTLPLVPFLSCGIAR